MTSRKSTDNRPIFFANRLKRAIKLLAQENITYHHNVTDARGEHVYGYTAAFDREKDQNAGRLEYAGNDEEIFIQYINVPNEYKRKGIGTKLVETLIEEFSDAKINWGMITEEGGFLKEKFDGLKQAIKLLALNINKEDLYELWYENNASDKFVPDFDRGMPDVPDGFDYQWSRFPTELTTNVLQSNPDNSSTEIMVGHATWSEDLVLAMVESGDFTLSEAIIICSEACGRCLNVLYHDYGLKDGFPEGSKEWQETNTECDFCRGL